MWPQTQFICQSLVAYYCYPHMNPSKCILHPEQLPCMGGIACCQSCCSVCVCGLPVSVAGAGTSGLLPNPHGSVNKLPGSASLHNHCARERRERWRHRYRDGGGGDHSWETRKDRSCRRMWGWACSCSLFMSLCVEFLIKTFNYLSFSLTPSLSIYLFLCLTCSVALYPGFPLSAPLPSVTVKPLGGCWEMSDI